MGGLLKEDFKDLDFIDAVELASNGTTSYSTGVTVVSTTASTKRIVFSGINLLYDKDERAESDDLITLSGTSGGGAADGTYTIDNVIDETTVDVVESIVDSTGGTAVFKHPPGAIKVGIDPTNIDGVTSSELQEGLEQLSQAVGSDDKKVQVDSADASYDYLYNKLQEGDNITLTKVDTGSGVLVVKIDAGAGRWWRHFLTMGG